MEKEIVNCERDLIAIKTGSTTTADSAKLYCKTFTLPEIPSLFSTTIWDVQLVAKNGEKPLIVNPIFSSGVLQFLAPYDSGCSQYPQDNLHIVCAYYYLTAIFENPRKLSSPRITIYSTQEIELKSATIISS